MWLNPNSKEAMTLAINKDTICRLFQKFSRHFFSYIFTHHVSYCCFSATNSNNVFKKNFLLASSVPCKVYNTKSYDDFFANFPQIPGHIGLSAMLLSDERGVMTLTLTIQGRDD